MVYRFYHLLARCPLGLLYLFADTAALLLEKVFRYRRRTVDDNLTKAFPTLSIEQRAKIRQDFYRNLAEKTLEIMAGVLMTPMDFKQRLTIDDPNALSALTDNNSRSVIVLTLHQGNWEWMLHRASAEFDITQAFIYKRLHNSDANRFSLEARMQFGAEPIEMRDAARDMIRHRRRPRMIYVVGDQSPGKRERVHHTQFLNQSTAFFMGAATLARATGFPVAFASSHRVSRGHYDIHVEVITESPKTWTEEAIIERYAVLCEQAITAHPADWLWTNRRWKFQPIATEVNGATEASTSRSSATETQSKPAD